ncbi:Esterase SGNH hydrolase-type protein [Rutstroemia sp. NJR-2017a BBW]|nr:Esterase SGNH hydrolase-type protein [Rutstroemia sp. NJR-2017a BBW]
MRAFTRLGALVFAAILSLLTILTLLPETRVTEHFRKIEIGGTSLNDVSDKVWDWAAGGDDDDEEGGVRLVVFGDSWVDDTIEEYADGKGKSWTEVLCEELQCVSHINMAASQPSSAYPSSPPTGALTSNEIHLLAVQGSAQYQSESKSADAMLPDFKAQVQSFIALPPPTKKVTETIFILSFGTWDVWHLAGLDPSKAQAATDAAVEEMFFQLDNLYAHYRGTLESTHVIEKPAENENRSVSHPQFRVVIPKLFDPTLLPGWLSQRPVPLKPSSVAEQQKNAVHLLGKWELAVENKFRPWFATAPEALSVKAWTELAESVEVSNDNEEGNDEGGENAAPEGQQQEQNQNENQEQQTKSKRNKTPTTPSADTNATPLPPPLKDVFYYDLQKYLLDLILEHQLEDAGISDASGLGTKESPFISVYDACLRERGDDEDKRKKMRGMEKARIEKGGKVKKMTETPKEVDINGLLVCADPDDYLFWDEFSMGGKASAEVGREVAGLVRGGKSLRRSWGMEGVVPGS